jgi:hypothetical protein
MSPGKSGACRSSRTSSRRLASGSLNVRIAADSSARRAADGTSWLMVCRGAVGEGGGRGGIGGGQRQKSAECEAGKATSCGARRGSPPAPSTSRAPRREQSWKGAAACARAARPSGARRPGCKGQGARGAASDPAVRESRAPSLTAQVWQPDACSPAFKAALGALPPTCAPQSVWCMMTTSRIASSGTSWATNSERTTSGVTRPPAGAGAQWGGRVRGREDQPEGSRTCLIPVPHDPPHPTPPHPTHTLPPALRMISASPSPRPSISST